jgi:hypothetical protein
MPIPNALAGRLTALVFTVVAAASALAQTPDDALKSLNAAGRDAYALGRETLAARTTPVIIAYFDDLILHRDGTTTREKFTPALYHRLKSVSHIALGTAALLASQQPGDRTGPWRAKLETLRDQARAIGPVLAETDLSDAQKARQEKIVTASLAFLDTVLAQGVPTEAALNHYASGLGPLLLANANDAAKAQLDGLHALMQRWRAGLSPEEWQRLNVVVMGGRQPRAGNLQFSYFVQAMGRQAVDRRLIYAEGLSTPEAALALLKTIVVDRAVGTAFFDDDTRMERDLLADAAEAHLLTIFGRLGSD